jgi:uncharacterized protein (TIGR00369 family)
MTALEVRHRSRTITWSDPAETRAQLTGLDGYERLTAMQRGDAPPPPAVALLDMSLDEVERGRTVFSIVADELFENPMGTMHGGIVATLVDTAMGCAISSTLPADAGFTTLELSTNFVRAITTATGRVHAEGRVIHGGGRVATTEARVYDDSGTLYAHATSTCLIIRSRQ